MTLLRRVGVVTAAALVLGLVPSAPAQALPGLSCREEGHFSVFSNDVSYIYPYCKWYTYTGTTSGGAGGSSHDSGSHDNGNPGPGHGGGSPHSRPDREQEQVQPNPELCEQLTQQRGIAEEAIKNARERAEIWERRLFGDPSLEDEEIVRNLDVYQAWHVSVLQISAVRALYVAANGEDPRTIAMRDLPDGGSEIEVTWDVEPGAKYSDSLSQALDEEIDKRRELNTWMDKYDKDEKARAKWELSLIGQELGRYKEELALIERQMKGACAT